MEVSCSFKSLVGGICGFDTRDRGHGDRVVPLLSCTKDISNHLLSWSFSGPKNEIDLVLCRAGIFKEPDSINTMTICPFHRGKLGIGWKRGASRCRIPAEISKHGTSKNKKTSWPIGDRGLSKDDSQLILRQTGIFVQAGSGRYYFLTVYHNV